ncbi:MAG TPA: ferritin-like domain-containing protein [Flavitalea sp.]|nr:ferritin-like domain-containing protein [Flavitalea sp.]
MEKMKDLKDLLIHEIQDLYSAEEQIIEALPLMIKKAKDDKLVKALRNHLKVTEKQKDRLDEVKQLLNTEDEDKKSEEGSKKGFFGGFFGGPSNSKQVCRGMQGLIDEGQKVMGEDMSPEVLDAAIIACAQKIEHYEICGYGTARAYARELNLRDVFERLEKTLNEEYDADDLLTDLAVVGGLNEDAEIGSIRRTGARSGGNGSGSKSNGRQSGSTRSGAARKAPSNGSTSSKASLRTNKSARVSSSRSKNSSAKTKSGAPKTNKSSGSRRGK